MNSIAFPIKPQMKNAAVCNLQRALVALEYPVADAETKNRRFGRTTRAAVAKLQAGRNLPATGEVDEATAQAINGLLAQRGVLEVEPGPVGDMPTPNPPPEAPLFSVEGEVVKPDGTPLRGHVVRAFDRALCDWRPLGPPGTTFEARSDEHGRYQIEYARSLLHEWGKTRADLKVEVHDPSGDVKLAESPLILQALPREVVNFAIGKDRYRGPDEYTRVVTALAPFIGSHDLACLSVPDVLILAREAKLPTSAVAYYVKASRWSAELAAPVEMFYGLMRRNQPTRLDALLARPLRRLWAALTDAKNDNIIDLPLDNELRRKLATLQQQYLAQPDHPQAKLLKTTALSNAQQTAFTEKLIASKVVGDEFWQSLADGDDFSPAQVADLRNMFELQAFAADNTSLTIHLRSDRNVRFPREVAGFSVETWRDTVLADARVETPDEILPGENQSARRAAYAQMLYRAAEARYPTASLAGQMSRSDAWAGRPVSAFLAANPNFEFNLDRVTYFLQEHPEANNFPDEEAAKAELLRVEQLFHLTPGEDKLAVIQPLWDAGLRSAPQIACLGRQRLMRIGVGLDRAAKTRLYRQAVHITSLALSVYMRYHARLNSLAPAVIRTPQLPREEALARAAESLPEWETLFGSTDACDCSHNDSVLGPPAYLVDIMAFLLRAIAVDNPNRTALDELLDRRPDLGTLQLTNENTDTELPQIDLVCQILESIVASSDHATLSNELGQTTWESAQLAAQQEHLNPAAYETLREARYSFSLPFDLWLEESRRYLKQMGIARDELMQLMPPRPDVGALEIATESLGMSARESAIIRDPSTGLEELAVSWGVDLADGTLRAQLVPVETLIGQAAIDYDTLLRLLNTRYVNPARFVTVSFAGDPCSFDGAELTQADGSALSGEQFRSLLSRLHRFLRLQCRLTLTVYELDLVLAALGVEELNEDGLFTQLAAIQKLRTTTGLSVGELCSWWGDLSTFAFEEELPSKYEEAFLDVSAFPDTHSGIGPDLRNDVFALTPDRTDLAITTSTDATLRKWLAESDGATPPAYTLQPDYSAYLQSVTRLTAEDLMRLVETVLPKDGTTGHVALNLVNVSLVYRTASFTRGIESSVSDYLTLVRLTGMTPLRSATNPADPLNSLNFHARFLEINEGQFSIQQLAYLLRHDPDAAVSLAPTPESMDAWLAASSPAFTGIVATSPADISAAVKASLTQSLGSTLGLDSAVVDALLFTHCRALGNNLLAHLVIHANPDAPNLPTPPRDFHAVFETVHKFGIAWTGLGLDPSHLAFVLDQATSTGWMDIASLPVEEQATPDFAAWRRLAAATELHTSVFTTEQSLFGLVQAAIDATPNPGTFVLDDFLAQLSLWSGWSLADLKYLTGPDGFNLTLPDMMQDERPFVALRDAIDAFRSSGASAEQAHAWAVAQPSFTEAQSIKQTLMLSYDAAQWLEVLAAIQDELRPLRRDALLGYLLHTLGFEDSAAFYQHYLIDPEQAACARTSRMVEAQAAVQLFAQRILFNLEPFTFSQEDAEGWKWRKNYRVWEAARKVFLYPQNWLEPEWRSDKSSFFKDLEDGLSQDDINLVTAERLYREYLYKLDQVSRLEIMGMYEDSWQNGGVETSVVHVVGHTRDVPQLYYYRRWEDRARWTTWEQVTLDITGNHVVPIVYNGRLYLFWADFKETQTQAGSTTVTINPAARGLEEEIAELEAAIRGVEADLAEDFDIPVVNELTLALLDRPFLDEGLRALLESWDDLDDALRSKSADLEGLDSGTVTVIPPIYEIELGIAWSQYRNSTWSAKTLGTQKLSYEASTSSSKHFLIGWVSSTNQLRIAVTTVSGERTAEGAAQTCVGYFYFDETHAGLVASRASIAFPQGEVYVSGSYQRFQAWDTFITETLSLEVGDDTAAPRDLLGTVPAGIVDLHFAHQHGLGGSETAPFFYSDDKRTYFVEPLPDAPVGFGSLLSTARMAAPLARVARSSARTALTSSMHYQDVNTDEIIDRATEDTLPGLIATQASWSDVVLAEAKAPTVLVGEVAVTGFRYRFTRFYHPYTSLCLRQLSRHGVDGLLKPDPDWDDDSSSLYRQLTPDPTFDFVSTYAPNSAWVFQNYATEQVEETFDFDHDSPYGVYNWELFFHIPLLIASRLMQNQRFDEAQRWFHYIFDPTCAEGEETARFWKIKPFYQAQLDGPAETLEELIALLEEGNESLEQQVREWERAPFDAHAIARLRQTAYMQTTVRKYLDCLIQHGDTLFGRDTREFVKDAAHLYLLAAEVLGEPPTRLPARETTPSTPNLLLQRYQIALGPGFAEDIMDRLTSLLPATLSGVGSARSTMRTSAGVGLLDPTVDRPVSVPTVGTGTTFAQGGIDSLNTLPLFCIPPNDLLDNYWATVSDRLFKIRHCMNISGQVRQLALYSPPINPLLLVRAAAAGLEIDSIVGGALTALPAHRFAVLLPKALELCGEVRYLGSALLAALEKKDGEALSALRGTHEVSLLKSIRTLKGRNVEEAESSLASLTKSKESAEFRVTYYASLERVSGGEQKSLDKQEDSRHRQRDAEFAETIAAVLHIIPSFPNAAFGGPNLGSAGQAVAAGFRGRAAFFAFEASKTGTMAGYDRRLQEWTFQRDLAAKEVEQLDQQIVAAEIRREIAIADLGNHDQQIAQSTEVEEFLKLKFTSQELYSWMVSKLSSVYFQAYQLAYQMAKQAERAFQHELGPNERDLSFFDVPYWDSLKKGLSAGEQLLLDLRRLEQAHLDANHRELEITKPVSLLQLDPKALLALRQTGACDIHIPEVLFDLDFAGHVFRRMKAVRLTIPGVAGPYTNVSATLTLVQSWTRREVPLDMSVPPERDTTVLPQTGIATCTGMSDSGMFEFGFNDPRYLPFEGAGVISTWHLELPSALRPFDYNTIADVVLHISYTARAATDGGAYRDLVNSNLVSALNDWRKLAPNGTAATPARLFSLRHEFPSEWNRLTHQADGQPQSVMLSLGKQHFPRYLDFLWTSNGAHPISLSVSASRAAAILSPTGSPPPETEMPTLALSGLSDISNDVGTDVVLTVEDGVLDAARWRDLYLLLPYEVIA